MRLRNKVNGSTFLAELDLGRMANQPSHFVLVLHDDSGGGAALGPLAASLGYEIVESTPEELARLMLAGFPLPRERKKQSHLRQLTSVMRAMKPKAFGRKRTEQAPRIVEMVALKEVEPNRKPARASAASLNSVRKQRSGTTGGFRRAQSLAPSAKQHSVRGIQGSSNPDC